MRRKPARRPPSGVAEPRALAPSNRAIRLPTAAMLRLALGAGVALGGAMIGACSKSDEGASTETTRKPATSSTTALGTTSASVSCSASQHVADDTHIPPSEANEFLGGKMMPVKPTTTVSAPPSKPCKCPPGVPLCGC